MQSADPQLIRLLRLPKLRQVGFVVHSIERAVRYYATCFGIGPWHRPVIEPGSFVERGGQRIEAPIEIAVAYTGRIQLELIEPRQGDDSIYNDHLSRSGEGLHHLGYCVRDLERRLESIRTAGIEVLQAGVIRSAGGTVTTYAYLDTRSTGGVILELIEVRFRRIHVGMSPLIMKLGRLTGDVEKIKL